MEDIANAVTDLVQTYPNAIWILSVFGLAVCFYFFILD